MTDISEKDYEELMASIVYTPVCSNCGTALEERPHGIRYIERNGNQTILRPGVAGIYPYTCKKCGAVFKEIRLPKAIDIHQEVMQ